MTEEQSQSSDSGFSIASPTGVDANLDIESPIRLERNKVGVEIEDMRVCVPDTFQINEDGFLWWKDTTNIVVHLGITDDGFSWNFAVIHPDGAVEYLDDTTTQKETMILQNREERSTSTDFDTCEIVCNHCDESWVFDTRREAEEFEASHATHTDHEPTELREIREE